MTSFEDELAVLVARELPYARRDLGRLAIMVERLIHSLALVVAVGSGGKSEKASTLLDGVHNYLDETVADKLPFGRLLG